LFDETLKLFLTGHGARSLETLRDRGLLKVLLPNVGDFIERYPDSPPARMLMQALANTDARVQADKPVTPGFLFAVLLYGSIGLEIEKAPREQWHDIATILDAVDRAVMVIHRRVAVHRRFILGLRDMFALQPRLESPRGRRALRTMEHPRFRAAFDLLQLRSQFGMADAAIVEWWSRMQSANPEQRAAMAESLGRASGSGPARSGTSRSRGGRRRGRGGRSRRSGD
jgi:poly(A) polymerase